MMIRPVRKKSRFYASAGGEKMDERKRCMDKFAWDHDRLNQ